MEMSSFRTSAKAGDRVRLLAHANAGEGDPAYTLMITPMGQPDSASKMWRIRDLSDKAQWIMGSTWPAENKFLELHWLIEEGRKFSPDKPICRLISEGVDTTITHHGVGVIVEQLYKNGDLVTKDDALAILKYTG